MKKQLKIVAKKLMGENFNYYRWKYKFNNSKDIIFQLKDYNNEEILIISVDNPNGGESVGGKHIHLDLLQKGLSKNKFKSYLLSWNNDRKLNTNLAQVAEYYDISLDYLKKSEEINFAVLAFIWQESLKTQLINILKHPNKVKVINAHDIISSKVALDVIKELELNIPIVTTLHGYFSDENIDYGGLRANSLFYKFYKDLERYVYSESDKIITVDTRIKNYVLTEVPSKKENDVIIIKNAINDERFQPVTWNEIDKLRNKYNLLTSVILVPRRLVPKNGVIYIAKAIKQLVDRGEMNFKLIVAGDGPQREIIEQYIHENGLVNYIELLGDVTHNKIQDYFALSDIIVVPSVPSNNVEEATSLAALEGMASGKITIATEVGGLKELIINNENGYLVPPKSINELADILEKALHLSREEYNKIAQKAREDVIKNHGYINHANAFYGVYKQAIYERSDKEC